MCCKVLRNSVLQIGFNCESFRKLKKSAGEGGRGALAGTPQNPSLQQSLQHSLQQYSGSLQHSLQQYFGFSGGGGFVLLIGLGWWFRASYRLSFCQFQS